MIDIVAAEIAIITFMVLEFSNILALYFKPDFKFSNAIGIFNAFEKTKEKPDTKDFVRYLVNCYDFMFYSCFCGCIHSSNYLRKDK